MSSKRIAIIGSRGYPYVYSGYETLISELSPRLVELGIEVHVYNHKSLFKNKPNNVNGVFLHYIPAIETKSLSQITHSFLATIHAITNRYDLILYVNAANGIFGILTYIFRQKTAINVDGLEWLRPKWKGIGSTFFYFSAWMATKFMDTIITDAEAMKEIYKREFNCTSTVIAYGANPKYSTEPELINEWNLMPNNYYLIVGRLIPDNNSDHIVEQFIRSTSKKKLVIVGDVPYNDQYAMNIKKTSDPRVIFTGYVNCPRKLAELYHNCYAYLHGHEYGGTNPTLLKALAYGAPIIALDTVFSREVLENGTYGLFFSKEQENLASVLSSLEMNNTQLNDLSIISRERIVKSYTWEKITNQYLELISHETKS